MNRLARRQLQTHRPRQKTVGLLPSDLPAAVDSRDAARQIAVADPGKTSAANKIREFLLSREAADALNEITIGFSISGGQLAKTRNDLE